MLVHVMKTSPKFSYKKKAKNNGARIVKAYSKFQHKNLNNIEKKFVISEKIAKNSDYRETQV